MDTRQVFRARSCAVGFSSLAVVLAVPIAIVSFARPPAAVGLLFLVIIALVLFFAAILPTMKYTVTDAELIPSCGPFRWRIPLEEIKSVLETDLEYLSRSEGWKLPGYTLFRIRYGQIGAVRMCATSMTKRIVVIETSKERWGITPADAQGFLAAVEAGRSVGRPIVAAGRLSSRPGPAESGSAG